MFNNNTIINTWKPVKDYIRDHIKPNDRDKYYSDSYDPGELETVIKTQQKHINICYNNDIDNNNKYT